MIISDYSMFRLLANPGGAIGADGLTEFDPANMRKSGFNGGFSVTAVNLEFPLTIYPLPVMTIIDDIDDYDWYVSQRTSIPENKPFEVVRIPPVNHSIELELAAWAAIEYPDPFDISTIRVLFANVDVYCIRRSDTAIQRLNLMQYLLDILAPKTGIE